MIEKIVSGGQTGVDRAALDTAIALGIPHGGWLPKGRRTEDGPLAESYQLQEMASVTYKDRTLQNVIDSDGTLIIVRGSLSGGSAVTLRAAKAYEKPCLLINLTKTPSFLAASRIAEWWEKHDIKVLNIAGPRGSKDPTIYADTRKIVEGAYYLGMMNAGRKGSTEFSTALETGRYCAHPGTLTEGLKHLISDMALKDRVTVANMTEREVLLLDTTLGRYIAEKLDLWSADPLFIESYTLSTGKVFDRTEAPVIVLLELWRKLKVSHKLRVVK